MDSRISKICNGHGDVMLYTIELEARKYSVKQLEALLKFLDTIN